MADVQVTVCTDNDASCLHRVTNAFFRTPARRSILSSYVGKKHKTVTFIFTFQGIEGEDLDLFLNVTEEYSNERNIETLEPLHASLTSDD